jgi:hypothetical protein
MMRGHGRNRNCANEHSRAAPEEKPETMPSRSMARSRRADAGVAHGVRALGHFDLEVDAPSLQRSTWRTMRRRALEEARG